MRLDNTTVVRLYIQSEGYRWRNHPSDGSHLLQTTMSKALPPGFYVPAVLFFQENEDLDIPAIQTHVLRLAQVGHKTRSSLDADR